MKRGEFKAVCKRGHTKARNGSGKNCRECIRITSAEWRDRNYARHSDGARQKNWRDVGILNEDGSIFTINDFNRHFQIQGGSCKICGTHQATLKRALAVDHDHSTGLFRGLLCSNCNSALGLVDENTETIRRLVEYLEAVKIPIEKT
jgi:hypothetical protein